MSARLRIEPIGGDERAADLPENGMLILGSAAERAGFVLAGQGVEEAHCAIGKIKSGGWAIKDLGSRYGTLVNGSRITSQKLQAGDQIVLGSRRLQVVDPEVPAPAPVAAAATATAPAPPSTTAPESAPSPTNGLPKISGYRVERVLGRGGMGQVYLAVQESLNRPVALKLLTGKFASDLEFVRRFQSEARAAAAWNHPNVVVVHDVGDSDGQHFLSMEYMPGGNLEQAVANQGPLSWRRVLEVLHDAAGGLAYAEEKGILHRDIKPANLMLSASGSVKIADLGLATQVEAEGAEAAGPGGKVYGTPHFISPEQARGERVDHRSDLYSLGATAYRLLSGQTPFQGETTREIVSARFGSDPVPIAELVPEIPPELHELVMRLMARDPADRFASAADLQREVDRLRLRADHGEPVVVQTKPRSRMPLLVGAGLVLVVALALVAKSFLGGGPNPDGTQANEVASSGDEPGVPFVDDPNFFGTGDEAAANTDTDERDLEKLDLQAKVAYHQIPSTYTEEERVAALRELAAGFDGTDTAATALTEADRIEADLGRARLAAERLSVEIQGEVERMRAAVNWPPPAGTLPQPGPALEALAGFRPLAGIAFDPRFVAAREELEQAIVVDSDKAFQAELERAAQLASAGDFGGVRSSLEALAACFDLPPEKDGEPSDLSALRRLESEIQGRIQTLASEEQAFLEQSRSEERRALGSRIGPESGFADSLRALELDLLIEKLTTLGATLDTEGARVVFEPLLADVQRARLALTVLIESFAADEWRRRAVADPRPRRSGAADIIAVDAAGLTLSIDGQATPVAWAEFGRDGETLERLFKGRLSRSYTAEEDAAIATLLRLVAVGQVTRLAAQVLDPAAGGILQPSEAGTMQSAFAPAEAWVSDAGAGVLASEGLAIERERKAAGILSEALLAAQSRQVSRAVASFEHLFQTYGDTLLVLMLSDGSGWRVEPPPKVAPVEPENGSGGGEEEAPNEPDDPKEPTENGE